MTTVADILAFLDTLAPRSLKMDWDNCGLLCGRPGREVHRILVALDPFDTVIDEAIRVKADLLVTHHPLIFRNGLMAVNEDTEAGRCVLKLVENGMEVVVPGQEDRETVNDVIFHELCVGQIRDTSRRKFLSLIGEMAERGAQAVILGCTEIGLLVHQEDTAVRLYDTTQIHAEAAALLSLREA